MVGAGPPVHDPVHGRPRRVDREHRAALDRRGPRLLAGEPLLDRQRIHPHLRRLPAARRAHGRPARPPARLHGGPDRDRGRLALRRLRLQRGPDDRRPRGPGPRRRDHRAVRALDRRDPLHRRLRAQQGAGRLGCGRGLGRRRRRPARRRAHRRPRLGVGPVGQRARRTDRPGADAPTARREPQRGPDPELRRRGRGQRHRGAVGPGLRDRRRRRGRLGFDADDRTACRLGGAVRDLRGDRDCAPRRRSSRSGSSS